MTIYFEDHTKRPGENTVLTQNAVYTIGWDLQMTVNSTRHVDHRWAEIALHDSDGNWLMTVARFGGPAALQNAHAAAPQLIAQINTWGWAKSYLNPNMKEHATDAAAMWTSPIDKHDEGN